LVCVKQPNENERRKSKDGVDRAARCEENRKQSHNAFSENSSQNQKCRQNELNGMTNASSDCIEHYVRNGGDGATTSCPKRHAIAHEPMQGHAPVNLHPDLKSGAR
jgi:hypothetical protein